jgi:rhodanese-related sulfurtransferase
LPGVSDKGAPIVIYGDSDGEKDVLTTYQELKKWRYKKVAILENGFDDWIKQGRPTASGPAADKIVYTRKLKKGAIPRAEFVKLEQDRGNVTLLDVRSPKETSKGTLQGDGALAIPLDDIVANLDKLPKGGAIVAYCSNGIRAEMAYETLKNNGYEDVRFLNETLAVKSDGSYRIE